MDPSTFKTISLFSFLSFSLFSSSLGILHHYFVCILCILTNFFHQSFSFLLIQMVRKMLSSILLVVKSRPREFTFNVWSLALSKPFCDFCPFFLAFSLSLGILQYYFVVYRLTIFFHQTFSFAVIRGILQKMVKMLVIASNTGFRMQKWQFNGSNPVNICFFKVSNRNTKKSVKYVQS